MRARFDRFWSYSVGYYGVWIGHIGRRLGLFRALEKSPMTPADLSVKCKLYPPAVAAWCSAATSYGFLKPMKGGRLTLTHGIRELFLDKTHPKYIGGQYSYVALRGLEYNAMDELFKHGKPQPVDTSFEAIEEATHWDHYAFIRAIENDKALSSQLTAGCKFIDIGCGTGSLIAKLYTRYPNSKYFGIDPSEQAIEAARKSLNGMPVTLERMAGEKMKRTNEFDIAFLGESLYAARSKSLVLSNCYRALKHSGVLAVMEGLVPRAAACQDDMLIMGMQLDFVLQGLKFMTQKELQELLKKAGFRGPKFRNLGGSLYLTTATKP